MAKEDDEWCVVKRNEHKTKKEDEEMRKLRRSLRRLWWFDLLNLLWRLGRSDRWDGVDVRGFDDSRGERRDGERRNACGRGCEGRGISVELRIL